MKRFAVTVIVEAEDTVDAVLAAGDILLDTESAVPGPNYGAALLAAHGVQLGDTVIQVREVPG